MKTLVLTACCVLSLGLVPPDSRAQQPVFDTLVRFEHRTYDAAAAAALQRFGGDMLLYVHRTESPAHPRILSAFGREPLAAYINTHFAPLAVHLDTVQAGSPLYGYQRRAADEAFVVLLNLLSGDWPHDFEMYGWKRIEDEADEALALALLRRFKHPDEVDEARDRIAEASCAVSDEARLIVSDGEQCAIEQLQARCDSEGDVCLVACLAHGRWRAIGGGCYHACLAYRDHAWTPPENYGQCEKAEER